MDLVIPSIGLIFWTSLVFVILLFLLGKFAWKPILSSVKERETKIETALEASEKAREEMAALKSQNEDLRKEALVERDTLLKEAREMKDKIVAEAKNTAKEEGERIIESAREVITNEKMAAVTEIKNQVATLSIEIAEKIVKEKLSTDEKQKTLVDGLVKEINLN
ncbi:F0F1 ATP synthase subunit B [Flavobacteriales bacterium]|jgi:F-type H+-transporting ATPase subunit b|nr:F0F1 ATP synthase subunit B [Flavobacteriales bacterium]